MPSQYFWRSTLTGLNRIGDIIIPQDGEMPSFSQFGGTETIDTIIVYLPQEERTLLNLALTALSLMPTHFLRWLVGQMEASLDKTGAIPSLLRQLNMGLRGIIFSCYYSGIGAAEFSGQNPLDTLGYRPNRVEGY